jgi:hypothetical protein
MYERVEEAKNSLLTPTPIPSLLLDVRGGTKGVHCQEKRVKISAIPRLVKFLNLGLYFRDEGAKCALASCKRKPRRGITVSNPCDSAYKVAR